MNITFKYIFSVKRFLLLLLLFCVSYIAAYSQQPTTIEGIVRDSVTNEILPFVSVQFDGTTIGTFTDNDGQFKLVNRSGVTSVSVSFMGYDKYTFTIPKGVVSTRNILLKPNGLLLDEVIVKPTKEKYSKKNNPAVELIRKVIDNKDQNNLKANDYYNYKEYERTLIALNDFKPEQAQFKRYKFLPGYMDTSLIDEKPILPVSVRETLADVYYRKEPRSDKRIVEAYNLAGIDQILEADGIDAVVKEVFRDISIFDNSIPLLLNNFVSPLSSINAVSFYKWYLSDTTEIDNESFVKLDFAPFNSRDVGFTGSLYISTDGDYAVKRAMLRAPKKININFVEELVIYQTFNKVGTHKWIPDQQRMAIDLSLLDAMKFYVDKTRTFTNVTINKPLDAVHLFDESIAYVKDYDKRSATFWEIQRTGLGQKDYRMGELMKDMMDVPFFKFIFGATKILWSGYWPTSKDEEKNKLDFGTTTTVYSYNSTEGNRFRLTMATTPNFHPHLFLYGYGAYGTRDNKFKYYGEATWAFNNVKYNKDEFPKNNLTVAYKYDLNSLGQRFTQAERDNILMSLKSSKNEKLTYNRQLEISYEREYHSGFSFKLLTQTFDERPAGDLKFEKRDNDGNIYAVDNIKTSEISLNLRYAPNEKFYQQRRRRNSIPSPKTIFKLSNTTAIKDFMDGQYNYHRTSFSVIKDFWIAPYGKLRLEAEGAKIWGKTPFPFLITPSANNSYTIQSGNFYLVEPLEFVHDKQIAWEVYYHMGGWFLNRVPFIKVLKWREVFGFRGFIGDLDKRNNPLENNEMLLFPEKTFTTTEGPYMEFNIGIENIFKFFRIDYVRRINYLDHPDINKDGFRISFDMTF